MNPNAKPTRFHCFTSAILLFSSVTLWWPAQGVTLKSTGGLHSYNAELAKIRALTNRFTNIDNALDAGYVSSIDMGAGCSTAVSEGHPSQLGAMGIHLVDMQGFGSPEVNFEQPSVLVYVPNADIEHCTYTTDELISDKVCRKNLYLAAVEEVVFAHLIEVERGDGYWDNVPTFQDKEFFYLHDNPDTFWVDEAHGFPPHYALHIWLYKHNPAGLYFPWNPNVACPATMDHH